MFEFVFLGIALIIILIVLSALIALDDFVKRRRTGNGATKWWHLIAFIASMLLIGAVATLWIGEYRFEQRQRVETSR